MLRILEKIHVGSGTDMKPTKKQDPDADTDPKKSSGSITLE